MARNKVKEATKETTKKATKKPSKLVAFKFFSSNEKYYLILLLALTIAGLLIRFYRFDFLTLWLAEYMHVNPAKRFLQGGSITNFENNGIFLTVLVVASFKLFGISEFAARLPSVLLGAFSIPLIYYLAKKLFNSFVGIIASLLATCSLYSIFWSRIGRNYACFEFSYLLVLIVFWLAYETLSKYKANDSTYLTRQGINKRYLILFPFVLIFSLLNHQLTFFFMFSTSCSNLSRLIPMTTLLNMDMNLR